MRLSGRFVAYTTMLAMLALSVAGNVAHTYHLNPAPGVRSLVYAVAWPVMVWLGVELFVRVQWRPVLSHRLVRWVGILLVASLAALVSYRHLRGLLFADGEERIVYTFAPLAVDGLMLMATLALLLTRKTQDLEGPKVPRRSLANRVQVLKSSVTEVQEVLKSSGPKVPVLPAGFTPAPVLSSVPLGPVRPMTQLVRDVPAHWVQDLGPRSFGAGKSQLNGTQVHRDLEAGLAPVVLDVKDLPPSGTLLLPARPARGSLDYAEVLRVLLKDPNRKDLEIAQDLGTSAKTVQRVRRATTLIAAWPAEDDAEIAARVKLPVAAIATIRQEMNQ